MKHSGSGNNKPSGSSNSLLVFAIAWRNLWRNTRRTALTAGGIAFACLLLFFSRSMQIGGYQGQIDASTALFTAHIQIQDHRYLEDPKLEYLVTDADHLIQSLTENFPVAVGTLRTSDFALLSVGERSFGAQVVGVWPQRELQLSTLPESISSGRYLKSGQEVVLGHLLARNLGAEVGDELVILGTALEGGVAAIALDIVGLFNSGFTEIDRALVQVPLDVFHEAFGVDAAAGQIVIKLLDSGEAEQVALEMDAGLPDGIVARPWQLLMPEVVQAIALDRVSARFMYVIVTAIVLFSIVNTFIMTIFERTREFGMLLAIGMHPWRIIGMLQLEALWLALLGGVLGALLAVPLLYYLMTWGIPLQGLENMTAGMILPSHMKGGFELAEMLAIPLVFVIGCQIAAIIPGQRVLRMSPVEALRGD